MECPLSSAAVSLQFVRLRLLVVRVLTWTCSSSSALSFTPLQVQRVGHGISRPVSLWLIIAVASPPPSLPLTVLVKTSCHAEHLCHGHFPQYLIES